MTVCNVIDEKFQDSTACLLCLKYRNTISEKKISPFENRTFLKLRNSMYGHSKR